MLRGGFKGRIRTYDVKTFRELSAIQVNGLSDGWALTSCDVNHCLFVSDLNKDDVYRVDVSTYNVISRWRVGGNVCGLSVNRTNNVLVTCYGDNVIKEYSPNGLLFRLIRLRKKSLFKSLRGLVTGPLHTVQLTDSQYVVCHNGPEEGVSVINERGEVISSYRNSETSKLVNGPRYIAVLSDSILIADSDNNRIILLNTSLGNARVLSLPVNTQLKRPFCMYLDQSRGRLYVGEWDGEPRVLVFDSIKFKC